MALFLYRIEPARAGMPEAPTQAEGELVAAHFAHLKEAYEAGRVKFIGRTEAAPHLGLALFEAGDAGEAERFLAGDPAVAAGVFRGLVQPFRTILPMQG